MRAPSGPVTLPDHGEAADGTATGTGEARKGGARPSNRGETAPSVRSGGARAPPSADGRQLAARRKSPRRNLARQPVAPLLCGLFGAGSPVVFGDGRPAADRKRTGSGMSSERSGFARCARKIPTPPAAGPARPRCLQTTRRRRPAPRSRDSGRAKEPANGGLFVRKAGLSAGPLGESGIPRPGGRRPRSRERPKRDGRHQAGKLPRRVSNEIGRPLRAADPLGRRMKPVPPAAPDSRTTGAKGGAPAERMAVPPCPISDSLSGRPAAGGAVP